MRAMKINNLFLCLLFASLITTTYGQNKESDVTQAELFSSQSGTLIEKQFIDIGKVKGISVKVLILTDLIKGTSLSCLRFEYDYKASYGSETKIGTLDSDEIDGLVKSIKILQNNVFPTTRDIYTEIGYQSRTGFEAGAYYSLDRGKWTTYVQIKKYDRNSMVFLTTDDFAVLLALIEKAKEKM